MASTNSASAINQQILNRLYQQSQQSAQAANEGNAPSGVTTDGFDWGKALQLMDWAEHSRDKHVEADQNARDDKDIGDGKTGYLATILGGGGGDYDLGQEYGSQQQNSLAFSDNPSINQAVVDDNIANGLMNSNGEYDLGYSTNDSANNTNSKNSDNISKPLGKLAEKLMGNSGTGDYDLGQEYGSQQQVATANPTQPPKETAQEQALGGRTGSNSQEAPTTSSTLSDNPNVQRAIRDYNVANGLTNSKGEYNLGNSPNNNTGSTNTGNMQQSSSSMTPRRATSYTNFLKWGKDHGYSLKTINRYYDENLRGMNAQFTLEELQDAFRTINDPNATQDDIARAKLNVFEINQDLYGREQDAATTAGLQLQTAQAKLGSDNIQRIRNGQLTFEDEAKANNGLYNNAIYGRSGSRASGGGSSGGGRTSIRSGSRSASSSENSGTTYQLADGSLFNPTKSVSSANKLASDMENVEAQSGFAKSVPSQLRYKDGAEDYIALCESTGEYFTEDQKAAIRAIFYRNFPERTDGNRSVEGSNEPVEQGGQGEQQGQTGKILTREQAQRLRGVNANNASKQEGEDNSLMARLAKSLGVSYEAPAYTPIRNLDNWPS